MQAPGTLERLGAPVTPSFTPVPSAMRAARCVRTARVSAGSFLVEP
jgi:hypothetical protein